MQPVSINKVDIKKQCYIEKIHMIAKMHVNTLLNMMIIKLALYHYA